MKERNEIRLFTILFIFDIAFIFVGIGASIAGSYAPGTTLTDDVFSTIFWMANLFFGLQSLTYIMNFRRSKISYPETKDNAIIRAQRKRIALLVPMYNEDPAMVRNNLIAIVNASKESANVYVLDDSTDDSRKENEQLCKRLNIPYIHRVDRHGYKAGALNNVIPGLKEDYVAVMDIDQMPSPDFLKEPVELLDRDPNLAFVQVPQLYTNLDTGLLANIANDQQFIFYDILLEGKSVANTAFSCGTNVIYRKSALASVGYFDEGNIVEDIATSILMLSKGWKTLYYNKRLVFGRAPVTMSGYINQQYRWASGSLALIPRIIKGILFNKGFKLQSKIDWLSSAVWYLYGWFYLIFLLAPFLAVIGVRILTVNIYVYVLAWLPYSIINLGTFVITHLDKKAPLRTVFFNMSSNVILFPLSIMATIGVVFHKKRAFVTARTGGRLPWWRFWPQFTFMFLLLFSIAFLVRSGTWYGYITSFWAAFQLSLLMPIFWLNRTAKTSLLDAPAFVRAT